MGHVVTRLQMDPLVVGSTLATAGTARGALTRGRGLSDFASGQVEAVFQSDWSFNTGSTANICSDNGKWNGAVVQPGPGRMDIIAAPVGFPPNMANVHRQFYYDSAPGVHVSGWPGLAIGSTRHFRYYFCDNSTFDASANLDHHQILPNPNNTFWAINHSPPGGTAYWAFTTYDTALGGSGNHRYRYNGITTGTIYKIRHSYTRLSATTFTLSAGLWLVDGTPVAVNSDLICSDAGEPLNTNYVHTQPEANFASLTGVRLSIEGTGGPVPNEYTLIGGFVIVDDNDPGDYGDVEGEATS